MIRETAVSVPGKAILLGEHAAVYGHPALVAAIDRRVKATVRPAPGGSVHLDLPGIGWSGEMPWTKILELAAARRTAWHGAFSKGDGAFTPLREPHELALIALGEAGAAAGSSALPGATVVVESEIPPRAGCGSSAAIAVAVVGAISRALGLPSDPSAVSRAALAVERQQHVRPSGVDVETVLHGGTLWFHRGATGTLEREDVRVRAGALAALRFFHTGTPAETTGDMIAVVRGRELEDAVTFRDALATIDAVTREAREALERGPEDALIPLVRRCEGALEELGVVPPPVVSAIRSIEHSGGAAKVSGAGGRSGPGAGLVLVVHPDATWHDRFALPDGWTRVPLTLGAAGLRDEVAA